MAGSLDLDVAGGKAANLACELVCWKVDDSGGQTAVSMVAMLADEKEKTAVAVMEIMPPYGCIVGCNDG